MAHTDENMGDPASLLRSLIACASVTPEEAGVLGVLQTFLTRLGFACKRLRFEGGGSYAVDNLFATRGDDGRHLLFNGHTDVVPPGDKSRWTHPPFAAEEANGMMWGRGAVDMKSGVAAFCAALARLDRDGRLGQGRISLAITNDEESDAVNGTAKLMQWATEQGHKFDFAIVGEPSSAQQVGDRLKTGRRGSINGTITVTGKQGHSAYPEKARNPIPVLADIAVRLNATPLDEGTDAFQPSNLEIVTMDVGNTATNVIPGEARLGFNIRFNDNWTADKLEAWVEERLSEVDARGCEISYARRSTVAESFVFPVGEAVGLLDRTISDLFGITPEHSTTGGTSDARFVAQYCPVAECGLVGDTMHETDERVPLADLEKLTELYRTFISRYLSA